MTRLVSNRHLIQANHRPSSEALTPMTGVGTCDGSGQVTSPHPASWVVALVRADANLASDWAVGRRTWGKFLVG